MESLFIQQNQINSTFHHPVFYFSIILYSIFHFILYSIFHFILYSIFHFIILYFSYINIRSMSSQYIWPFHVHWCRLKEHPWTQCIDMYAPIVMYTFNKQLTHVFSCPSSNPGLGLGSKHPNFNIPMQTSEKSWKWNRIRTMFCLFLRQHWLIFWLKVPFYAPARKFSEYHLCPVFSRHFLCFLKLSSEIDVSSLY